MFHILRFHYLDTVGVGGSIPLAPTKKSPEKSGLYLYSSGISEFEGIQRPKGPSWHKHDRRWTEPNPTAAFRVPVCAFLFDVPEPPRRPGLLSAARWWGPCRRGGEEAGIPDVAFNLAPCQMDYEAFAFHRGAHPSFASVLNDTAHDEGRRVALIRAVQYPDPH